MTPTDLSTVTTLIDQTNLKLEKKFMFLLTVLIESLAGEKRDLVIEFMNGEMTKTFDLEGAVKITEYNIQEKI
jgi:hypothetical protein